MSIPIDIPQTSVERTKTYTVKLKRERVIDRGGMTTSHLCVATLVAQGNHLMKFTAEAETVEEIQMMLDSIKETINT